VTEAWPARLLAARPLVVLGHASYATYILHVPCFVLAARFYPALWEQHGAIALYMGALAVASVASYRWIEEPLRRNIVRALGSRRAHAR
jgi:peptidoglycan/LPS O-acetylase OafA/YrhL